VRSGHGFHQGLKPGAGFSFTFDGRKVGPERLAGWQVKARVRDGASEIAFRHPSGLVALRRMRALAAADVIEYTVRFRNEGPSELSALSAVNALDIAFEGELVKGTSVVSCGGGLAGAEFPPRDFAVTRASLAPGTQSGQQVTFSSEGGMPSPRNLPLFFVENEAQRAGIYVGIGWTGNWRITISTNQAGNALRIRGGMPGIDIKLRPGEEISGPTMLLGCYNGPLSSGTNVLRRVIRDRFAPTVAGQRLVAPVLYTTWFDIGAELDEQLARRLVDEAAEIGQEIFLVDAGWYKGVPTTRYRDMRSTWDAISKPLGNWELGEERTRFPSGLRALADYVRSRGMQFGLWFEFERVGRPSLLAAKHPDWVTFRPKGKWGMVDFGRPEVQEYFRRIVDRYVRDLDLRYIRWDCNLENLPPYWAQRDVPGRRGMTEIRHLEGLHRVEDHIRTKHPHVILENCAGGGRRIDLASLRRRHTIWISDQTMDPHIVRFHLEGLNQFLPGNAQGVAFALPATGRGRAKLAVSDLAFQSRFGGAFGLAGRLHEWPRSLKDRARKHFEVFKKLRRFLSEDYYLLLPQSRTTTSWAGWQFHNPRSGKGFVQAFRLASPDSSRRLVLKGLEPRRRYRFVDPYTDDAFVASGATLVSQGLELKLPQMSSRVLLYSLAPGKASPKAAAGRAE